MDGRQHLARNNTYGTYSFLPKSALPPKKTAYSPVGGCADIYAINPEGGPVNIHTHIPSEPIASHEAPFIFNHPLNPKHMVLSVVERIKQAGLVPEENAVSNTHTRARTHTQ